MRKFILSFLLIALALGLIIKAALPARHSTPLNIEKFAHLPVQAGGRLKPLDTLARNSLLILSGKQSLRSPDAKGKISAISWLMDAAMRPEFANTQKIFRIDNDEVLGLFGWQQTEKYFSFNDIAPHFEKLLIQYQSINPEPELRSTYEKHIDKLYQSLTLYNQIIHTFSTGSKPEDLELEYASWLIEIPRGMEEIQKQAIGLDYDSDILGNFAFRADHYLELSKAIEAAVIPPTSDKAIEENDWGNVGQSLLDTIVTGEIHPVLLAYAQLAVAYRANYADTFNQTLAALYSTLNFKGNYPKLHFEVFFNSFEPFYLASILYLFAFITVAFSWLFPHLGLRRTAFTILGLAFLVHTFGLGARMIIQERPPVTNLYSSAIFVGFAGVFLSLFMERLYKNGLGTAVAGILGFSTLIIAHNLGLSGDTLQMVRAVLDSNFWLSTHVVVVTLGYSAMFLAGILGTLYLLANFKKGGIPKDTANSLNKMTYGAIAFATLFSFVGTMLGGIWADQSWGRFWGWDPKENGALLIVLWCAITLHARWGKLVSQKSFMSLAVFGNIVTAWSWFGTNMLGVGLHSYGFVDSAFYALLAFILSQLLLITISFFSPKQP